MGQIHVLSATISKGACLQVAFYKSRNPEGYEKALNRLIEETKQGKMYGEWNDYGRLQ